MKRVLVVDDEPTIRALLVDSLSAEGYAVTEASSGIGALSEVAKQRPDVIVLDLMMPVMDGRAFAIACHTLTCAEPVPILLMSASTRLWEAADQLRRFGVRGFVSKPFDLGVLIAAVDQLADAEAEAWHVTPAASRGSAPRGSGSRPRFAPAI